ncbi:hypothetical protein ColKHC_11189 [Colletotrichum higginsianum]|nr:hypothetical protein ColKHC_11189 [Colletotrichum higginsianum]
MLQCKVLIPDVDGSVPLLLTGSISARRKPVWTFVSVGAKMDLSSMLTWKGLLDGPSSWWRCEQR